ncbi:MAG TPA: type II secretion system protein, partial [Myxococcales bacterium]|nr:type II secretion system protein [Myxococcales bacterium]
MTRPQSRGFTLVELLVSVAILSVVMAGISGVLIKQSQASAVQSAQRDLEESARLALLELASAVRMAGYGIDPPAAFDFARYA